MQDPLSPVSLLARVAQSAALYDGFRPTAPVTLLPPSASQRRYARCVGADRVARIAMLLPPPPDSPDEVGGVVVTRVADDPFVLVQQWLASAGVPVPRIHAIDEAARILWLDDLGDVDLFACVQRPGPARMRWYGEAVSLLAQVRAAPAAPAFVTARSFDGALLAWELEHYVEWRLGADLGITPSPRDRAVLDESFRWLVGEIEAMPKATMHRDYQSRNLMVQDDQLVVIDFQDAMQGPLVYDAVALLRDSYVSLDLDTFDALVDAVAATLPTYEATTIARYVSLQTVQRKLKDAGRFVQLDRVRGNASFLQWIPNSLAYVDVALRRVPELSGLAETLRRLDPGIRGLV